MSEERKGIKEFLDTVVFANGNGVAVKSLFEVHISYNFSESEMGWLSFYVTDIDLPGKKLTTSTLYRKGREYDIPIIYDNNREFSMTILCDEAFGNYIWFEDKMKAGSFGPTFKYTIKIVPCTSTTKNKTIELQNVFFESLGSINFNHNSKTELITFTVSGRFRDITIS